MITPMKPSPIFIFEQFVPVTDEMIPGVIPNAYLVSNYGRVWSNCRNIFMNPSPDKDGYFRIGLTRTDYSRKYIGVHRLVAKAFIPLPDRVDIPQEELVVNHKDGNKTNNFVGNLEWCSTYENTRHAIETGLNTYYGERAYNSNFTDETVLFIADRLMENKSYHDICVLIGLEPTEENMLLIGRIKTKYTYARITEGYDFSNYHSGVGQILTDEDVHKVCKVFEDVKHSGEFDKKRLFLPIIMERAGLLDYYNSLNDERKDALRSSISRIKRKKCFPDITSQYDF